jgi:hypothetical protein
MNMLAFNGTGGQSSVNYPLDFVESNALYGAPVGYTPGASVYEAQRQVDQLRPNAGTDWTAAGSMTKGVSLNSLTSPLFRLSFVA